MLKASTTKGNYYSHGQVSKDHFDVQFRLQHEYIPTIHFYSINLLIKFCLPGIFIAQECQLHMTVCPKHRDACGTRWRTDKTICCVPAEVAGHKSTTCRGDRGIDRKQSCFVFKETGMLVPVGSRKCSQTLHYFSRKSM